MFIFAFFTSVGVQAQNGAGEKYLASIRNNAILGTYPSEEELRSRATKSLDDLEKNVLETWFLAFQIVALHYEADTVLNRNQDSARKELDRYNAILTKTNFNRPDTNKFFDSVAAYLRKRGNPEVSEIWWRLFLSSGKLTANPIERSKVWSHITDAEINQGAFLNALKTTDQWLAYEKNFELAKYDVYLKKARIGLLSNDPNLLTTAFQQLTKLKGLSALQLNQVKMKEFQVLYKDKKYSDCSKGLLAEIPKLPTQQQAVHRAALIRCLLAENKIPEAETQLHQLSRDVLTNKNPGAEAEEAKSSIFVSIAKKQKVEAFYSCISSVEPVMKEQSFNFLSNFAVCLSLKTPNEKIPSQILTAYNARKSEFTKYATRSEWLQSLLELTKAYLEDPKALPAAKNKVLLKFGTDSLIGKSLQLN